jgi:hypothetical protein
VFKTVFIYVFFIDKRLPDVSLFSSLAPTFNKTPISTTDGIPYDSVRTLTPLDKVVIS